MSIPTTLTTVALPYLAGGQHRALYVAGSLLLTTPMLLLLAALVSAVNGDMNAVVGLLAAGVVAYVTARFLVRRSWFALPWQDTISRTDPPAWLQVLHEGIPLAAFVGIFAVLLAPERGYVAVAVALLLGAWTTGCLLQSALRAVAGRAGAAVAQRRATSTLVALVMTAWSVTVSDARFDEPGTLTGVVVVATLGSLMCFMVGVGRHYGERYASFGQPIAAAAAAH